MSEADLEKMWAAGQGSPPAGHPDAKPPAGRLVKGRLRWEQAVAVHLTALYGKPGALLHDEFGVAYARHRECAGHYDIPVARAARMGYGYAHMALVQAPLDYVKWATATPLGLVIHGLLGVFVWLTLLLGGYL